MNSRSNSHESVFDHVIVGSGISALGAVLGLVGDGNILVLAGPAQPRFTYYDSSRLVPCAFEGLGGLGNYWHGGIPITLDKSVGEFGEHEFQRLFARFYPRSTKKIDFGRSMLFSPWRPIRPSAVFAALSQQHAITLMHESAEQFAQRGTLVEVAISGDRTVRCRKLWIAAGALHTPRILAKSVTRSIARPYIADHVLGYVGLVQNTPELRVERTREGVFFPFASDPQHSGLYTLRPARFECRELDVGFEQRIVFGMPTAGAISKILGRMSPGLLAEAFFNRFGIFANAPTHSVYVQTAVNDAYSVDSGEYPLSAQSGQITEALRQARVRAPFRNVEISKREHLYIPAIHLHHSVDIAAVNAQGFMSEGSSIQIVDASAIRNIGPQHHSFKLMVTAYARAQASRRLS